MSDRDAIQLLLDAAVLFFLVCIFRTQR